MLGKVMGVSIVVASALLFVLLQTTTPSTAGPLGILIIFILLYALALGVLTFLMYGLGKLFTRLRMRMNNKRAARDVTLVRSYYFSSVLALVPVIFIGMQSVGTIGFYEVVLVGLFMVIACVYIAKRAA